MKKPAFIASVRRSKNLIVCTSLLALAAAASMSAQAGECPADKVVAEGHGQAMSTAPAKGVTDSVVRSTDLGKEPLSIAGRALRARRLDIAPGGVVPWHSHGDRPAQILVASGEITEYASTCAVPILHQAGDITSEKNPTAHWWKNNGTAAVVIYSFDLFRIEDKKNEGMM